MKKITRTLRAAAKLVEEGEVMYGCHAINDAEGVARYSDSSAIMLYEDLYSGGEDGSGRDAGSWFGPDAELYLHCPRIVALCLAAAISADPDSGFVVN